MKTQGRRGGGLLQLVKGNVSARINIPGRPQALIVGKVAVGDFLGEMSLLLRSEAGADVVVDSDEAVLVELAEEELQSFFADEPAIASK